ncbi:hypothetical protein GWI33_012701 [Rhynchophorus ferrugineus]|uniref:PDZ domain-containing protein n=1 Tax=Rhynchophorus ferrugineus TaxID=354439 RepID=A0A834I4W4_RHYFE|nr:hypothetical protein GWI33_012701 [Rhynchophorus ferrugineus]
MNCNSSNGGVQGMFENCKSRRRTRSFSGLLPRAATDGPHPIGKPPPTPNPSPKNKDRRRRISEADPCPNIAGLRQGGLGNSCDQLAPCDRVLSVNGIATARMRPDDVTGLLDSIDGNVIMEVEYSLPSYASQNSLCVTSKVTDVTIERVDGSLGITLRGGYVPEHPQLSRPLIITHVRPNGPAYR